jgi:hypothetical protein
VLSSKNGHFLLLNFALSAKSRILQLNTLLQ